MKKLIHFYNNFEVYLVHYYVIKNHQTLIFSLRTIFCLGKFVILNFVSKNYIL